MNKLWEAQIGVVSFEVYDDRPAFDFFEVKQTHSSIIHSAQNLSLNKDTHEGDGIIQLGFEPITLAIKTADCLPIALIGEKGVALIHAGWRGFQAGILISKELEELKVHSAIIGPAIQGDSYEVTEEFLEHFPDSPQCFSKNDQKLTFNLPLAAEIQLKNHYDGIDIKNCKINTFSNLRHNSFRRDKTERRNYNVLKITEN